MKAVGEQFGPELFPGAPSVGACENLGGVFFCDFAQQTITDAKFPNAPRFSANYVIRYNFDAVGGNIAAQFDGAWYDEQYLEVTNGAHRCSRLTTSPTRRSPGPVPSIALRCRPSGATSSMPPIVPTH